MGFGHGASPCHRPTGCLSWYQTLVERLACFSRAAACLAGESAGANMIRSSVFIGTVTIAARARRVFPDAVCTATPALVSSTLATRVERRQGALESRIIASISACVPLLSL